LFLVTIPIVQILIVLVVVGVIFWLVETYIPLAQPVKIVIRIVLVLALCLWLLSIFGLLGGSGINI
jgi:hypothetical protein